ncbi:MAG: hypothetical protein OXU36_02050 [Candidatus Poribacteria bacterium]|nr:hypothetical protein [Candidatus Poribacteria bacterium]
MKKSNCAPAEIPVKAPTSGSRKDDVEIANSDIPPKKERQGPVPPPNYTLEELLAKVPEPTNRGPESNFSGKVDTGPPVGKEVW